MLQTEFEFTLPMGYVDEHGNVHREGVMRLATAIDEIAPMRDPRVRANEAYLTIILLARVIVRLGTLSQVNTGVVEHLFSADLAYLQDLYRRINERGTSQYELVCPACQHAFTWEPEDLGG
ncbi:MAG: phage tail assembly protein [Anaerolineae bacterium]